MSIDGAAERLRNCSPPNEALQRTMPPSGNRNVFRCDSAMKVWTSGNGIARLKVGLAAELNVNSR